MSFFFFKQKTAYEMRISDWSSDVCSSDLRRQHRGNRANTWIAAAAALRMAARQHSGQAPGRQEAELCSGGDRRCGRQRLRCWWRRRARYPHGCTRDPRAAGRERGSYRPGARRCEPVGMTIPPAPIQGTEETNQGDFSTGACVLEEMLEHELHIQ